MLYPVHQSRGRAGEARGDPRRAEKRDHPQNFYRQHVPTGARAAHVRDSVSGHVATEDENRGGGRKIQSRSVRPGVKEFGVRGPEREQRGVELRV